MQAFIVLCLVGAVFAHGPHGKHSNETGKDFAKIPGCENATSVKDIKASTCCTALPTLFGHDSWKNCTKTCGKGKGKGHCCSIDCVLKSLNISDATTGMFNAAKAKAVIKNVAAAWPVDTIVDGCVTSAPDQLAKWEASMSANNGTKAEEKCANPENMVIIHCIRHELIAQCPTWTQSDSCSTLKSFVASCSAYPFPRPCGKDGKKGKKH